MKKLILALSLVSFAWCGVSFWYLETSLLCSINKQDIKVSLKKTDGQLCKSYIVYIEQVMRKTARDIVTVQEYINKEQDPEYRQQIKKDKLAKIDKLQVIRLNIIASMKTFEANLLKTSVSYFMVKIAPYRIQLVKGLNNLTNLPESSDPSLKSYLSLAQNQVQIIDKIAQVKSFEELIPLLNAYVYFKQQMNENLNR